ncbi:RusA-like resolvase [Gordonia phage Sekhmet]|uniref:RusA-like resolvase n=1 Tax=Gordonia phage Sekhmet TaxID=2591209 RepID=A0A514DII1_9CAUD|nr:RusA-like Holliday junction resolvase [Gordonia phage Sekhmet]QDH93407.1 RusA-like resolvase [Gordonia phage Sekhmet]
MTTATIVLPYPRPPLTPNQRPDRHTKARLTREIRTTACWLAKSAKLAPLGESAVTATCTWFVPDRRKRDVGSLTLTAKAAIDGLVDAGILPADDWTVVTEERYRIRLDPQHPRIELTLEETP